MAHRCNTAPHPGKVSGSVPASRWRAPLLAGLALGTAFPLGLARAQAAPAAGAAAVFTEHGVMVDVTAGNAAQARDRAIVQAETMALDRLYAKLTPAADNRHPPDLAPTDLEALVTGFEVEGERASSVRYLGRMTVTFRPDAVRALLERTGVPYAEVVGKPALILPLDLTGAEPALWTDNPWRQAWQDLTTGPAGTWSGAPLDGLLPLVVAPPDAQDQADLPSKAARSPDPAALARLAGRHGAGMVVVAMLEGDAARGYRLTLLPYIVPPPGVPTPGLLTGPEQGQPEQGQPEQGMQPAQTMTQEAFLPAPPPVAALDGVDAPADAQGGAAPLLRQAVATAAHALEEGWKRRVLITHPGENTLTVALALPVPAPTAPVSAPRPVAAAPIPGAAIPAPASPGAPPVPGAGLSTPAAPAAPAAVDAAAPLPPGLTTLVTVRQRLAQVPVVAGVSVVALRADRAVLSFRYRGDLAPLRTALAQSGLGMSGPGMSAAPLSSPPSVGSASPGEGQAPVYTLILAGDPPGA